VRLDPRNAESHYLLALTWRARGNIEDTVRHRDLALALRAGVDTSVVLHELLAENYARARRFEDAARSAEHALQLARTTGKHDLAARIAARLVRYATRVKSLTLSTLRAWNRCLLLLGSGHEDWEGWADTAARHGGLLGFVGRGGRMGLVVLPPALRGDQGSFTPNDTESSSSSMSRPRNHRTGPGCS
jgi:hypothetical protein